MLDGLLPKLAAWPAKPERRTGFSRSVFHADVKRSFFYLKAIDGLELWYNQISH